MHLSIFLSGTDFTEPDSFPMHLISLLITYDNTRGAERN